MFDPVLYLIYKLPSKVRPVVPIIGGVLMLVTLGGSIYTSGNLIPYMVSYQQHYVDPTVETHQMVWFVAFQMNMPPLAVTFGGLIEQKMGPRISTLIGSIFVSFGIILTYFSIQHSYVVCLLTFGLLFGIGRGIVFGPVILVAMKWLPNNKGLATGLVCAGIGAGGVIFGPVQTKIVNPWNYKVNQQGYFTQTDLLERVPYLFLIFGILSLILELIGCSMMVYPLETHHSEGDEEEKKPLIPKRRRTVTETYQLSIADVLKTRTYWWIFFSYFCTAPVLNITSSFYKSFGQTFILDDRFLALVGSIASIFNSVGRIFWGTLADRYSYQVALCAASVFQSALMFTFTATKYGGKAMYIIWVSALNLGFSSNACLYSLVTAKCFGSSRMAVNYGFITLASTISSCTIAGLSDALLDVIGYTGIWFICGSLPCITFILTTTIQYTEYGKGIQHFLKSNKTEVRLHYADPD